MIINAEEIINIIKKEEIRLFAELEKTKHEKIDFEKSLHRLVSDNVISNEEALKAIEPYNKAIDFASFSWQSVYKLWQKIDKIDEEAMNAEFEAMEGK